MDKRLLSILCCPITHKGLQRADARLLEQVNVAISDGRLRNHDGHVASAPLGEALITDDRKLLYPVNDGIPVLLEGESIALDQLH